MAGPLHGFRVLELAGIGPGPFAGMMLADMGADVIRIDRPGGNPSSTVGHEVLFRNRRTLGLDLKKPEGVETVLRLCENADAIFEGYRPGVAERLGVGPEACLGRNPKIVYGRMTGWGQTGPMAQAAGHDINYIALSGALHSIGRRGEAPVPPLNLAGDFGGGGMMLACGILAGLLEASRSGKGQVIDTSMVEGSAVLMGMFYGLRSKGMFSDHRGSHMLDTGAHYYEVYETKDGKYVSIGSIEPQFYALLLEKAELSKEDFGNQNDFRKWPVMKEKLAAVIKTKTRDEWDALMEGTDVCYAPVLSLGEAIEHPHNKARGTFVDVDGIVQPAPAPRFSRSVAEKPIPMLPVGKHTRAVLSESGFSEAEIEELLRIKAVAEV